MVMFPYERVDLSFTDTAPFRFRNSVDLAITPEQLFEVLAALGDGDHQGELDQSRTARCRHYPNGRHARGHRRQRGVPFVGTAHPHGIPVQ
jgi:hypothetical protein